MGTWGEGLYADDEACDVRDLISLLSKMPSNGDCILQLALEQFERNENLGEDGCPTFWMVVADQFTKRGIVCDRAIKQALLSIDSGADLADLKARGMEPQGLKARKKVHEKLRKRIDNPKPASSRRIPKTPPKVVVEPGEIYSFPTMDGSGFNAWFSSWDEAGFVPNGWGSLIILEAGRVFDWFPWASYTPLVTNPAREPTLKDGLEAKTLFSNGVAYFAPKKSHMNKMGMNFLGKVELSSEAVQELKKLSHSSPKEAVMCDWSICSGAFSRVDSTLGVIPVCDLLLNIT
ncbi:hypothetical protein [Kangiella sp.]|uniref:hypothetical protein n=1 Tax=Kangiella sp. TaxID=1920245 RepID=UPI003A912CA7